ncbi:MAG: hypothetical protein ABH858_05020 [Candidatus Omnitrophota bacterium]
MKKRNVGLYLGEDFVITTLSEGTDLIAQVKLELASVEKDSSQTVVDKKVFWNVLINKGIKEVGGNNCDIFVSLPNQEFIFRYFTVPFMSKKEVDSTILYEIEKYIPFKIEEMIWDYRCVKFFRYKKINISFLGMKKFLYQKYENFFTGLSDKSVLFEPSSISLIRLLKSIYPVRKLNDFALLELSDAADCYITFFHYGLPVFNKSMSTFQDYGLKLKDPLAMEKLQEEIRVSLQYFTREFRDYKLDKLIVVSGPQTSLDISSLKAKLGIDSLVIDSDKIVNGKDLSIEELTAYAAAAGQTYRYRCKFNPVLSDSKVNPIDIAASLLKGINFVFISIMLIVMVVINFLLSLVSQNVIAYKEDKFKKKEESVSLLDSVRPKSLKDLKVYLNGRQNFLLDAKRKDAARMTFSPLLDRFPQLLTDGLWIDRMYLSRGDKMKFNMEGTILLLNLDQQRESFDLFVANIKNDDVFKDNFEKVNIVSFTKGKVKQYDVIKFELILE